MQHGPSDRDAVPSDVVGLHGLALSPHLFFAFPCALASGSPRVKEAC